MCPSNGNERLSLRLRMTMNFPALCLFLLLCIVAFRSSALAFPVSVSVSSNQHHHHHHLNGLVANSRQQCTTDDFSSCETAENFGLLSNIDVKTANYYSSQLKMDSLDDIQWLDEPGLLWNAASADARARNVSTTDYIQEMLQALLAFHLSDEVHDREEFIEFLETVYKRSGCLLLVLGGKSVGKSLVLSDFARELQGNKDYMPVVVNARYSSGKPLSDGILREIQKFFTVGYRRFDIDEKTVTSIFRTIFETFLDKALGVKGANQFLDALIKSREFSADMALMVFVNLAKETNRHPVLIIDEANKVLGLGANGNATSSTLDQIVLLTKETNRLEVVMASSEYGYPYRLEDNGLNLNDITEVLFAGEIPPKSMWELLVTKTAKNSDELQIGMGENLARLLIAAYGGHFLRVRHAVKSLARERHEFCLAYKLNPIANNITVAMNSFPFQMPPIFRQLAEKGFAPVKDERDPMVEMIVKSNIAGIVVNTGVVVGLPKSNFSNDAESVLVPTSQSARNLIAKKVLQYEKKRVERRWWKRIQFWRQKK